MHICIYIYIYIYVYTHHMSLCLFRKEEETEPNRPNRTEPNRLISEPAGTGRGNEPKRTGPRHYASEKRRPNCVEPRKIFSEPNRTNRTDPMNCRKVRNRKESNRTGSFLFFGGGACFGSGERRHTVSFHNLKLQNFKVSVSNPKSKYVAYLSLLSQI